MKSCYFESLISGRSKIGHKYFVGIKNEDIKDAERDDNILTPQQRQKLCKMYETKRFLTVPELAIYLNLCPNSITKLLSQEVLKLKSLVKNPAIQPGLLILTNSYKLEIIEFLRIIKYWK